MYGASMQRSRLNAGGVTAKGQERIQFDFILDGVRYRPSIKRRPTDANLQRALEQLQIIRERIRAGTFRFESEFPSFRDLDAIVSCYMQREPAAFLWAPLLAK
jgi:hypothetical protein